MIPEGPPFLVQQGAPSVNPSLPYRQNGQRVPPIQKQLNQGQQVGEDYKPGDDLSHTAAHRVGQISGQIPGQFYLQLNNEAAISD